MDILQRALVTPNARYPIQGQIKKVCLDCRVCINITSEPRLRWIGHVQDEVNKNDFTCRLTW